MNLSDIHPFVMVLFIVAFGITMRRSILRRTRRRRNVDAVAETRRELERRRKESERQLEQHEVRLHETARTTEAVLQTKLSILDEMVAETDREIARLEDLLEEAKSIPSPLKQDESDEHDPSWDNAKQKLSLHGEPAQFVRLLHQSGFSAEEISRQMDVPLVEIQRILNDTDEDQSRAA
ncbi:MAG: hypothetical protein ACYTGL_02605 [Planctomycetota bacterium]|jgi:hypothetical protein